MTDDIDSNGMTPENLFKTALNAAGACKMHLISVTGPDGTVREYMPLPSGFELRDVTAPVVDEMRLPYYRKGYVEVDERQSLIDYVNRFKESGTVFFADVDNEWVTAAMDFHTAEQGEDGRPAAGARRHNCVLKLRQSEEFQRWNKIQGIMVDQGEFAEFLEENASDLAEPDPATMIELARDISASIGGEFKSKIDLNSGDRTFHYKSETQLDESIKIPKNLTVRIPIYQGEEQMDLTAAFRYRVSGGSLQLGFEWRRVDYQRLALFKQIAVLCSENTGAPYFMARADC